jgi:hypothetical protein
MSSPEHMVNGVLVVVAIVLTILSAYLLSWAKHSATDDHHFGGRYAFAFLVSIFTITYITHLPFAEGIGDFCVYPVKYVATRMVTGVWPSGSGPIRREIPAEVAKPLDFVVWNDTEREIQRNSTEIPQGWRVVATLEPTKPGGVIVKRDKPFLIPPRVTKVWVFMDPDPTLEGQGYWRGSAVVLEKP